jgi:hypothetical protein
VRERLGRIGAILVADGRERLRRTSTLVTFLAICFAAYLWVPDPSTGRALMVIDARRAVYNSPAVALATAMLGSFLIGLFGYYVVSHSIGRDLRRRTGAIVAASPTANWEYLLGKGLGNFAFLALLAAGYMVSSMAVQLVRSDEPLALAPYVGHYLFLLPASLLFTSTIALLFEAVPWLSGKLGDVLYFFVWMTLVGVATALAIQAPQQGVSLAFGLDVTGMATTVRELQVTTGTQSLAVGASSFDPALEPYSFPGLSFGGRWLVARGLALLLSVPIFLLAWWRFHRFDPARVKGGAREAGKGYGRALQGLVRPVSSLLTGRFLAGVGRRPGLLGATVAEAALTLIENPLGVLVLVAAVVTALSANAVAGALPVIVAAMAVAVAGAACRESSHGTRPLVYAAPRLRPYFVGWKLAGALILCWLIAAPAALRFATSDPARALSLLTGAFFVAAAATAGGVLTGSAKAFLALFLSFWYVVLNDGGKSPGLDFAGFYGTATLQTAASYLALGLLLLGAAQAAHWRRTTA